MSEEKKKIILIVSIVLLVSLLGGITFYVVKEALDNKNEIKDNNDDKDDFNDNNETDDYVEFVLNDNLKVKLIEDSGGTYGTIYVNAKKVLELTDPDLFIGGNKESIIEVNNTDFLVIIEDEFYVKDYYLIYNSGENYVKLSDIVSMKNADVKEVEISGNKFIINSQLYSFDAYDVLYICEELNEEQKNMALHKKEEYTYLGNGKFSKGNLIDEEYLIDALKYHDCNSCEEFIDSFYGNSDDNETEDYVEFSLNDNLKVKFTPDEEGEYKTVYVNDKEVLELNDKYSSVFANREFVDLINETDFLIEIVDVYYTLDHYLIYNNGEDYIKLSDIVSLKDGYVSGVEIKDNKFIIYSASAHADTAEDLIYLCEEYEEDKIIYMEEEFVYLGNGNFSEGSVISKETLLDILKNNYKYNSCESYIKDYYLSIP